MIQEFQNFGSNYNPTNDQSLTFQDETVVEPVIVVAVRDSNGFVHAFVDGVIELTASAFQLGRDAWNTFTSAVDYTWKSFTGFISDTAAGFGGVLDKAWNFVKDLFTDDNISGREYFLDSDAGHQKFVLTETSKEKNSQHDKDVLALIESLHETGYIHIVNLGSQAQIAHFLTSIEPQAISAAGQELHDAQPMETVQLIGVLEAPLLAA